MGITKSAYEKLLREYDEMQLAAKRDCLFRTQKIEAEIPEITEINSQIAARSVDLAVARIKGRTDDRKAYDEEKAALLQRRKYLLEAAGYSEYDLEPHYKCSICKDTGFTGSEKCSCLKSKIVNLLYDQSNIRDILQRENFKTYTLRYYSPDPDPALGGESPLTIARKAAITADEYVGSFEHTQDNLFISGATGTGKTFLSNCIAKAVLDKGHNVIYLSAVKLFGILADSTFGRDGSSEELFDSDLLIIDDLGTEYTNAFVQSAFFNCINERILRGRHTIISTNLSMEQIRDNYSERVFSRIAEKYILIRLFGEDIRLRKKLEE